MFKLIMMLCLVLSTSLYAEKTVLAFAGSSREESFNNKLVLEAAEMARQAGAKVTVINLKDYSAPFYDGDLEIKEGMPAKAKELRQLMIRSNLILIASPEYNGSLSALLKNAIDWASRNEKGEGSRDAFKGKKFALMSTSPGAGGGSRGLTHLRAIIENVGGTVIPEQVVIPNAFSAFDEQGHLKENKKKMELQQLVQSGLR